MKQWGSMAFLLVSPPLWPSAVSAQVNELAPKCVREWKSEVGEPPKPNATEDLIRLQKADIAKRADQLWGREVTKEFGRAYASLSTAKNIYRACYDVPRGIACVVAATPCKSGIAAPQFTPGTSAPNRVDVGKDPRLPVAPR